MATIFHIISRDAWERARRSPEMTAPSLDSEGFIHFSTIEQVIRVANLFYRGVEDLIVLAVDTARLSAPLRWEPPSMPGERAPATGELFPHLYGALNTAAVREIVELPCLPDGAFALPAALEPYLKA